MASTKKGEIACSTCSAANLAAATFCRHCRATGKALHGGAAPKAKASKKAKPAK